MINRKLIYYMRWLLSAIIMTPIMIILEHFGVSLIINLIIGQSFGALIFWNIDKKIFK